MSKDKLSDYQKALRISNVMPRFYLGQEVETKDGNIGIIVDLTMAHNGLYLSPQTAKAVVWFGTGNENDYGWVNKEYPLYELRPNEA